jgi:hypothetical protein
MSAFSPPKERDTVKIGQRTSRRPLDSTKQPPKSLPGAMQSTDTMKRVNSKNWGWYEDDNREDEEDEANFFEAVASGGFDGVELPIDRESLSSYGSPSMSADDSSYPVSFPGGATPVLNNTSGALRGLNGAPVTTAPDYVLEESISSQKLWNLTAQNRPVQPAEERSRFEEEWIKNFEKSNVDYTHSRSQLFKKNEDIDGSLGEGIVGIGSGEVGVEGKAGLRGEFVGVKGEGVLKKEVSGRSAKSEPMT